MITATGIGSNLDINSLVKQLVAAEGQPKQAQLDRAEKKLDARLSALGTLKGALSGFQSTVSRLSELSTLSARSVSTTNEASLAVKAANSAAVGTYSIEVIQLAQAEKQVSSGFANATTAVGTGTLSFTVGSNSFSVTIDSSNNTLAGIRDAINQASGNTSVSASVVNVDDGSGGTVSRLILTARETGTANAMSITLTDDDGNNTDANGLSALAFTQQVAASDAVIKVDGLNVTRSTNTITDAIDGLTLDLKATTTSPAQIGVSIDSAKIEESLNEFVKSYNNLRQVMGDLGKYDPITKTAGALVGDSTLRTLQQSLRESLTDTVSSASGDLNSLGMLGIQVDRYGVMSLDSIRLQDAIKNDLQGIVEVFQSSDGVATRTKTLLDGYLSSGGQLDGLTKKLNEAKRDVDQQRDTLSTRLQKLESIYLKQFNKMDLLVAQYNSTGAYLAQQLAALR